MANAVEGLIEAHHAAGRDFTAAGIQSFVRDEGSGDPIVLMHGLPSSAWLYRKVIPLLAAQGHRALCFDLPGLGLASRPKDFDYTFPSLGAFSAAAVDTLGLGRFHLVVHDAGGPVGFEMIRLMPERIASLTLLNTIVALDEVPFVMERYAAVATGPRWPAVPPARVLRQLFYRIGIADTSATPADEVDVYRELIVREDDGRGYLAIMRNVEHRKEVRDRYESIVDTRQVPYPVQILWSADDRVLPLKKHGWGAWRASHLPAILTIPGKHYFQEDRPQEIAAVVDRFVRGTTEGTR
ncbi:MAG: alpha/beta fold hydrolase [Chloroflexota bacterium]